MTRFFLKLMAVTGTALLSGCVPPPDNAAIWDRPPRYGAGGTQSPMHGGPPPGMPPGQMPPGGPGNRYGYPEVDGRPPREGRRDAGGQREVAGPQESRDDRASQPRESSDPDDERMADATPPVEDTKPADDKPEEKPADSGSGVGTTSASGTEPPKDLKSYPFGRPVAGKTGFVTLPSPHDKLGEIDVRGIAPGTPVEIPDPNNPGKKIYFRVP